MRSLRIEMQIGNQRQILLLDRLHAEPEDRNRTVTQLKISGLTDRLHAEPEDRNLNNCYGKLATNGQAPCGA